MRRAAVVLALFAVACENKGFVQAPERAPENDWLRVERTASWSSEMRSVFVACDTVAGRAYLIVNGPDSIAVVPAGECK